MYKTGTIGRTAAVAARRAAVALVALMPLAACDLSVTNPGRVNDTTLDSPDAAQTLLNGLVGDVEVAIDNIILHTGLASDELGFSGTRSWLSFFGKGDLNAQDVGVTWDPLATAIWTSENGVERISDAVSDPGTNALVAAAHVWAGYALRIGGDTFCQAVFNGEAAEPNDAYYTRAIGHFQAGHDVAESVGAELDSLRYAALAGLAQSHLILGNYDEAADYAAEVPDGFLWVAHRSDNSDREENLLWSETHVNSQATVFGTPIADLGPDGDPRTPWVDTGDLGAGGSVEFYRQLKYTGRGSDIPLAKHAEMRLIEAEALLRDGKVGPAMDLINQVRAAVGVSDATAGGAAEAWAALDHERLVTLWLEGRRFKDNQRFYEEGRSDFLGRRDMCFPFSDAEINSNENL